MKRMLVLAVLVITSTAAAETMTNADIRKLHGSGLSPELIVEKIRASQVEFDISTDALIALHEGKVPEVVIREMIRRSHGTKNRASSPVDRHDPKTPAAAAPPPKSGKRYRVAVHRTKYDRCPGEVRIDAKGLQSYDCGRSNVAFPWSDVRTICTRYGARGEMEIELRDGKRQLFSMTTPIEAEQLSERIAALTGLEPKRCDAE